MIVIVVGLLISAAVQAEPAYHEHPAATEIDPYRQWKYSMPDGTEASCCHTTHCAPAPYRWETGEVQLPDGRWVDPRSYVAPDGIAPSIRWSSSMMRDEYRSMAHACVVRGYLRCVALPGEGV